MRLRWRQRAQEVFQRLYFSLFPFLAYILSLLPHSLAPIALTATLVGNSLVFLSHSVSLVFSLCMLFFSSSAVNDTDLLNSSAQRSLFPAKILFHMLLMTHILKNNDA